MARSRRARTTRAPSRRNRGTSGITATEGRAKTRMQHANVNDRKLIAGVAVAGKVYKRGSDGVYLIDGCDVPAMVRQGLVRA